MRNKLGDKVRLQHILDAIEEIDSYLVDVEFDAFLQNSMMRYACIKQMEIIGEASDHITDDVKAEFTEIEWGQIKGMRNVFVHEYFGVDSNIVWEIINGDIPVLKVRILEILNSLN